MKLINFIGVNGKEITFVVSKIIAFTESYGRPNHTSIWVSTEEQDNSEFIVKHAYREVWVLLEQIKDR